MELLLGRLGAGPDGLQLLVDDAADLVEAAEADALRVFRRRLPGHLDQRRLGAGILLVEALPFCELVSSQGDRQVAGLLVPFGLHPGPRAIGEEIGDAGVFLRRVPAEASQAGAAEDRVLRPAFHVVPARQGWAPAG